MDAKAYNPDLADISKFLSSFKKDEDQADDCLIGEEVERIYTALKGNNFEKVFQTIISISKIRNRILTQQISEVKSAADRLNNRKHGYVSVLMKKELGDLQSLKWMDIFAEFKQFFPEQCAMILSMMTQPDDISSYTKLKKVLPKVGFIYGIIMQTRNVELSKLQRLVSMLLIDQICDQKVFDRLNTLGACLSYERSMEVMELIGGTFNNQVVDLVKSGKQFRIIGDNINWRVGVHDQRADNQGHMEHAFGSAIIVQNIDFGHLNYIAPQREHYETSIADFVPSREDLELIKQDYVVLCARAAFQHIPFFQLFKDVVPENISKPFNNQAREKSKVIPLPVLFLNEQYYAQVVQILAFYEKCLCDAFHAAGKDINVKPIHIGGDQLTRERFSGAKAMRAAHATPEERFSHLSPITSEIFHLQMNFLKLIFKELYKSNSVQDLGSLKSLQERISRKNVGENVNEHYDADKDFVVSVTNVYIVECVLQHFGMDTVHSPPTRNAPPQFENKNKKKSWFFQVFGEMIEEFVFKTMRRVQIETEQIIEEEGTAFQVTLANGKKITLLVKSKPPTKDTPKEDRVQYYGHLVLELGLMFQNLIDLVHIPDRDRGIRVLKLAMVYFKSHKNLSKYAFEILRFLVHQTCILSERAAYEEFFGLFVNTAGLLNSHIPADRQMEYLVKKVKKHIKHMFANKTEKNIGNRTRAIAGIHDLGENFDKKTGVIVRSKKHSDKSSLGDEITMLQDVRRVRPFQTQPGRNYGSFADVPSSITAKLDVTHFHQWIDTRKVHFALELGN